MKLNVDCVRDILLYLESNQVQMTGDMLDSMSASVIVEALDYSSDDIYYCLKQMDQSGLLDCAVLCADGTYNIFEIEDITPEGHEFLQNIHDDNNWSIIKTTAKKVGSFSLDILSSIAINLIHSKISSLS